MLRAKKSSRKGSPGSQMGKQCFTDDVEFYAEDAGRTDNVYLAQRNRGGYCRRRKHVVNIPDTTGYCLPHQYGEKIAYLVNNVKQY